MATIAELLETRATDAQRATVARMKSAPAASWVVTSIVGGSLLGVPLQGVAIQIEEPKLKVWGVVLPNGNFLKPKPGRKTLDASDITIHL